MSPYVVQLTRSAHIVVLDPDLILLIGSAGLLALHYQGTTYYLEDAMTLHERRDVRAFREDMKAERDFPKLRTFFAALRLNLRPNLDRLRLVRDAALVGADIPPDFGSADEP